MIGQLIFLLKSIPPAAVVVFVTKELFEWFRRRKAEKAKRRAYAHVLGREIKNNLEFLNDFFKIIDFISEHSDCREIKFKLYRLVHGYESCQIKAGGSILEMPLPKFQTTWYEKTLADLAEKDEMLSMSVSKAYDNIYFLSEKRNLIASLMADELSPFFKSCMATMINVFLLDKRTKMEEEIKDAYKVLTGKDPL